jgi:hypothetical protein
MATLDIQETGRRVKQWKANKHTKRKMKRLLVLSATFSNISAISWRSILVVEKAGVPGEPPTMGKQLENLFTSGCESSASVL